MQEHCHAPDSQPLDERRHERNDGRLRGGVVEQVRRERQVHFRDRGLARPERVANLDLGRGEVRIRGEPISGGGTEGLAGLDPLNVDLAAGGLEDRGRDVSGLRPFADPGKEHPDRALAVT